MMLGRLLNMLLNLHMGHGLRMATVSIRICICVILIVAHGCTTNFRVLIIHLLACAQSFSVVLLMNSLLLVLKLTVVLGET